MMTACGGGDKNKTENGDAENKEVVNEEEENAEEKEAEEQGEADDADVWGNPAQAMPIDLVALYASGDFKPAVKEVFVDTLGGEAVGELPSQWDILSGGAEVGKAELGYGYISMLGGTTELAPMAGGQKVTLPASYTMEFELMFGRDVFYHVRFFNADEGVGDFNVWLEVADWNFAKNDDEWIHGEKDELGKIFSRKGWNHFAVSYDKGNMKIFLNGKRIANMPNIKSATNFLIVGDDADGSSHYIRNIRIAQ